MSSLAFLPTLVRYKAWADDELYRSLATQPDEALRAEQPIVFGSILRTLHHVYAMDSVWKAHLEGRAHGFTTRNPDSCPSFQELRAAQRQIDDWYIAYVDGLPAETAEAPIDFTFIGGGEGSMSPRDMVLHVVNHTTYHRGHIGDMIYRIPAEPPTTDLSVYLRERSG